MCADRVCDRQENRNPPSKPLPRTSVVQTKREACDHDFDGENPWLDGLSPESVLQPGICWTLRRFEDGSRRMRQPDEEWPYRPDPHNDSYVYFYDFRGVGDPPNDVGYVGDIYMTKDLDVWVCQGTQPSSEERRWTRKWSKDMDRSTPVEHPLLQDRYLWFRSSSSASVGPYWYGRKILANNNISPTRSHDFSPAIRTMFEVEAAAAAVLSASGKSPLKRKEVHMIYDDDDYGAPRKKGERTRKRLRSLSPLTDRDEDEDEDEDEDDDVACDDIDTIKYEKMYVQEQTATRKYISKLQKKIKALQHERSACQNELDDLKKSQVRSERKLKAEIDQLKERNHRLRTEKDTANEDLRKQVAGLTAQKEKLFVHVRAMASLDAQAPTAVSEGSS